uniref:BrxA family protein n=1 Tax=Collinsella aerofaciens TaxID=74426 RepID=UPI0012DE1A96
MLGRGALVTAFDTLGACTVDVTTKSVRGGGVLTREQFLPHEMRIVAALRMQGASDEQVIVRVKSENLFQ